MSIARRLIPLLILVVFVVACDDSSEAPTTEPTPTGGTTATGGQDVVLSGEESFPDGFVVPAGHTWSFDPNTDTTVSVSGNVIVEGTLEMKPASGDVVHLLLFEGVDDNAFVGGGFDPVDSDVGLWVVGDGRLDIEGAEKTAWGYEYDPGWEGDEVVAAPNDEGDYQDFVPVTSTPTPNALGYQPELLDLTRNVRIEGTPEGYTHVFIRSTQPQTIRYAALRWVAPELGETDATGRYGIHFHMAGDGSRGSIVEGVVIRDTGNHAFVAHASHGVTFRDTIAFEVANEAYWWDEPPESEGDNYNPINDTNDLVWDHVVAAGVRLGEGGNKFRLSAFFLGNGQNVSLTNSVAVGVQGEPGDERSGFVWPEAAGAVWTFENNVAHNNGSNGIFTWQNNKQRHDVDDFTAYYNGGAGVIHGAYENSYQYTNLTLLDNGLAVVSNALGAPSEGRDTQVWTDVRTDGGALLIAEHATPLEAPVRFVGCDFEAVIVADAESDEPSSYEFVRCDLEPDDFDLRDARPDGAFRVQRGDGTAFELDGDGTVTEIEPFYSD
jgi:hypothetical protein